MIKNVDDVINVIGKLVAYPHIEKALKEEEGYTVLDSSSANFLKTVEDDELIEGLQEVELSASHYFFSDEVTLNKAALSKLKKRGYDIIKLESDCEPFTHAIDAKSFHIFFSL